MDVRGKHRGLDRRRRKKRLAAFSLFPFLPFVLGGLLGLVLEGCAGHSPKINRDWQSHELYWRVAENYRRLQSFRGRGSLTIESPQIRFNAPADILVLKPDSLFIKVEAALGIDAGFFFVDRGRFASFSPFDNVYYHGETEKMRELMFFRMELTYDEMLSGLLGAALPPFDSSFTVTRDGEAYRFDGRRKPRFAHASPPAMSNTNGIQSEPAASEEEAEAWRLTYWVDADRGVVTKAEQRYDDGELYARQQFKRFHQVRGVWLPRLIQMERPSEHERMTIFYNHVDVNKKIAPAEFAIRVPKNAKRVDLSDPAALPELKNF